MRVFPNDLRYLLPVGLFVGLIPGFFAHYPARADYLASHQENGALTEIAPSGSRDQLRPIPEAELRRMISRGGASRRGRAGTRGDCPAVKAAEPSLTAIVPIQRGTVDGSSVEMAVGTTASAYPSFWFYLPYGAENLDSVRFVVNDESEMPLFEPVVVPLRQTAGLVTVQLPPSAPPLEVGKYYHWYVILDCAPVGGSDAFVDAFVQRVEVNSDVEATLATAPPEARVDLLLHNQLWHEALDQLYQLQAQKPSEILRRRWAELLAVGGLEPVDNP